VKKFEIMEFLGILVIGLIFISGCTSTQTQQQIQNPGNSANNIQQNNNDSISPEKETDGKCSIEFSKGLEAYDKCIIDLAKTQMDEKNCDLIKEDASSYGRNYALFDRDLCFLGVAIAKKDGSLCSRIVDAFYKSNCESTVSNKSNYSIQYCDSVGNDNSAKDLCLAELAANLKDASICGKISGSAAALVKPQCYAKVAMATDDVSICDNSGSVRDWCYLYLAELKKDSSLCDNVPKSMQNDCMLTAS